MPINRKVVTVDCALILIVALGAQAAAFTSKMGRAIVCADSYQYVAAAEALLDGEMTAPFEMRKPGYPLFLAGVWLAWGRSTWGAVVANHLLLATLPLAVYALGAMLRSRWLGWLAALLLMARLQMAFAWRIADIANWIMSESLYAFLLSFGLLVFFLGLHRRKALGWLISAGALLGLAWLTRGVATAIILVAMVAILVVHRRDRRTMLRSGLAFMLPILACVVTECMINQRTGGAFRPSRGTSGSCLWSYRLRAFQGVELTRSDEAKKLVLLLPERSATDAFVADAKDQWVATARAFRRYGLAYAAFDDLCWRAALDAIAADPWTFAVHSAVLAERHLMRLPAPVTDLSPVHRSRRGIPIPSSLPVAATDQADPYAQWSLPNLSAEQSNARVARMREAGAQRAPFIKHGVWSALAYWRTNRVAVAVGELLAKMSMIWPGFAILLCPWLGLNRRVCFIVGAMYVVESLALSVVTVTNVRYQSVWMATDTAFAAALPAWALAKIVAFFRARLKSPFPETRPVESTP